MHRRMTQLLVTNFRGEYHDLVKGTAIAQFEEVSYAISSTLAELTLKVMTVGRLSNPYSGNNGANEKGRNKKHGEAQTSNKGLFCKTHKIYSLA